MDVSTPKSFCTQIRRPLLAIKVRLIISKVWVFSGVKLPASDPREPPPRLMIQSMQIIDLLMSGINKYTPDLHDVPLQTNVGAVFPSGT